MKKITSIIVEDSRLARNELKVLIGQYPQLEIIGEAENADQGIELIQKLNPDVLFLDINMPGRDGFELLEDLVEIPITIFTTAYDEYAIKSFEYNALDYLLKPINEKRFAKAIDKIISQIHQESKTPKTAEKKLTEKSQLFVKDGEKCWMVKLSNIKLFEISGNYTQVFFDANKPLIYKSLNQIEAKLPQDIFFRANRQQIINIRHIESVVPWFNGKLKITLSNKVEVEISRRASSDFKSKLSF